MRLRWNPDGRGKREIPPRLAAFARAKRRQFFGWMLCSLAAGLCTGRAIEWLCGVPGAVDAATLLRSARVHGGVLILAIALCAAA